METAAPQGRSLDCKIEVNGSSITEQEEVEVKKAKAFIWRPGKELTEKVEVKISNLEDSDDFEDFQSENEDWKSDDQDYDIATQTVFPEMTTVTQYEQEDWDKEMEDIENNKNSYDGHICSPHVLCNCAVLDGEYGIYCVRFLCPTGHKVGHILLNNCFA